MSINLLTWRENRQQRQFKIHLATLILLWIFIALGIGVFRYYLNLCKEKYELKNRNLSEKVQMTQLTESFQQLQNQYQSTQLQLKLFNEIKNQKKIFWRAVTALQNKLPDGVRLDRISWRQSSLQLQGVSRISEQVNGLMQLLEAIDLFDNVSLDSIHQEPQSTSTQFIIHAEIKAFKHDL